MRLFNKVAVIGTGLIGGSLALVIKKNKLAREVVGVSRHKKSLDLALENNVIDRGSRSLDIIKGADLLILATPVETIINLRKKILSLVDKDCIVTDVGSTKAKVVSFLDGVFKNYVGSHPLAGSEKRGIMHASSGIFKDALCVLTPTGKTRAAPLKKIKKLWAQAGSQVVFLSPQEHDKILSFTSHLPHVVVFSLMSSIPAGYLNLASGGLKDTTRIAASDALLWRDIILSNRKNVLKAILSFEKSLRAVKSSILKNDKNKLEDILSLAQKKRASLK